ncbi:MAG: tRNA-dihydrouridine synthase [Candidatus Chaera renei]|uniref:tRNA-dihydrouridine synthase n=1 Tax=Candidatus Chaera renei TaxID=2506947 RepID=A0A4Q0AK19_9BACT|nr:MAG: tRNA-dihydrouridine synthase [Candidatus Chaera renei]
MKHGFWRRLPRPFFVLAPMDGVTDTIFRRVVAKAAPADVYFSEFTNATSYCHPKSRRAALNRLKFTDGERPLVAQIWGTEPTHFARFAKAIAGLGYDGIDINMGCPERRVVKQGACSALIENPDLAARLIAAAKTAGLPVSVKTRIGFKAVQTEWWLGFLLQQDLAALTVHGRTQKEMSKVPARWDEIAKAVVLRDRLAPDTLIIGNGDVRDRAHGERLCREFGVDGVMIGRGVFANPFCFETKPAHHGQTELLCLMLRHLELFSQEPAGHQNDNYQRLKRFFKIYLRDFNGAAQLRDRLMHTKNVDEAVRLLRQFAQAKASVARF